MTLKKWVRILGLGVRDRWKITGYHHPTIQGTAPKECWTGFCRLRSSCNEGMSLFALVCRSAAGRHRRCAGWAPACSGWWPHAPGNQGSPVGGGGGCKIRKCSTINRSSLGMPTIKGWSDLFRWQDGDVVLVDGPGLLLDGALVRLNPELITG